MSIHIRIFFLYIGLPVHVLQRKRVNRYRALPPLWLPPLLRCAAPGRVPPPGLSGRCPADGYLLLSGLCPKQSAFPSLTRALPLPTAHPVSTGASPLCRQLTHIEKAKAFTSINALAFFHAVISIPAYACPKSPSELRLLHRTLLL